MSVSYGELCTEVYDLSKPLGFSFGDVEFYLERLSGVEGKVLEVGCGSGRVLIPLLQAGIDIEGIDHSRAMLDSCRRRCEALNLKPQLYEASMHHFAFPHLYEAIIMPVGTFQLIESREQAMAALNHFYHYLLPGGRLILDLFIPDDFSLNAASVKTWNTSNHEVIVMEEKRIEIQYFEQKIVSLIKYEKWKDGSLIQSELQLFPIRWYGHYEFELLLEKAGFQDIVKSADYAYGAAPSKDGQMMTYEAKKPA